MKGEEPDADDIGRQDYVHSKGGFFIVRHTSS